MHSGLNRKICQKSASHKKESYACGFEFDYLHIVETRDEHVMNWINHAWRDICNERQMCLICSIANLGFFNV